MTFATLLTVTLDVDDSHRGHSSPDARSLKPAVLNPLCLVSPPSPITALPATDNDDNLDLHIANWDYLVKYPQLRQPWQTIMQIVEEHFGGSGSRDLPVTVAVCRTLAPQWSDKRFDPLLASSLETVPTYRRVAACVYKTRVCKND